MLARSCLTLLLCCTSTLAMAKEPAMRAEGPAPLALRRTAEPAPEAGPILRNAPDLTPDRMQRDWKTEQRWLQAGTGVSWVLAGLGTIGFIVPLSMLSRCNRAQDAGAILDCSQERRTAGVMAPILGVLTVAAIIPAVMFTRRLVKHDDKRPNRQSARLGVTPGGLSLQF